MGSLMSLIQQPSLRGQETPEVKMEAHSLGNKGESDLVVSRVGNLWSTCPSGRWIPNTTSYLTDYHDFMTG